MSFSLLDGCLRVVSWFWKADENVLKGREREGLNEKREMREEKRIQGYEREGTKIRRKQTPPTHP